MSVSPRIEKQVAVEFEQLRLLLGRHPAVLEKCRVEHPTAVEVDALAALLHGFYTGIENILVRIRIGVDGVNPRQGAEWHGCLLAAMAEPGALRPALMDEKLRKTLRGYLDFRHVFRHAYSHVLDWDKMAPLVLNLQATFEEFEKQIGRFLTTVG